MRGTKEERETTRGWSQVDFPSAVSGESVGTVLQRVHCRVCGLETGWDIFGGENLCVYHEHLIV